MMRSTWRINLIRLGTEWTQEVYGNKFNFIWGPVLCIQVGPVFVYGTKGITPIFHEVVIAIKGNDVACGTSMWV